MVWANRRGWFRYRQIGQVLARHGLRLVAESLGLGRWWWRFGPSAAQDRTTGWPERIRQVLTELGPTYIKLGQLASTRSDLLPPELGRALESLQDHVEPFAFGQVRKIVEDAWKRPMEEAVSWFDKKPMAAASIGQVHAARLNDGRSVVIKVLRPGIVRQSQADFAIVHNLAEFAQRHTEWGKQYDVVHLVDDLIALMRAELDFGVEAANTVKARRNLSQSAWAVVPEVIWPLSGEAVLVMERQEGIKISDRDGLIASHLRLKEIAQRLVGAIYQQIFEDGFFHADPHPGNIHVDPKGRLIWLDWGLVGRLSDDMKSCSADLVMGLSQGRAEVVVKALLKLGVVPENVDQSLLWAKVEILRHRYYDASLQEFELGRALIDLFSLAQSFRILIPSEYLMVAKAAVLVDGAVRRLDPALSLVELSKPFAARMLWQRLNPAHWATEAGGSAIAWSQNWFSLPEVLGRALDTVGRGEIRIIMEHKNIDSILRQWEKFINRIGFSFLLGAVILAVAMVVHANQLDQIAHFRVGEYAFMGALVLALGIVIGAARRGKL